MSTGQHISATDEPSAATRPRATLGRHASAWPILALISIPTAIFVGAFVFGGHLLLTGDNLIQNYPLRSLVGSEIRQGLLPAWDPFVFGGTPLLAGLNAGAFFPSTLLFALLTPSAAWVAGNVLVYSSLGVGTFLLFRAGGAGRAACFLGACAFTFAGAVSAQSSVHVDMADGIASLPWALLAVRRIIDDGRWRWSVLLGVSLATAVLSGSPEAVLEIATTATTFAFFRWTLTPGATARLLSRSACAVGCAVGGTAFVWIPALRFISVSQRAGASEASASSYAFPPRSLVLAVLPYLEGGYRLLSQASYFGRSNAGEVTLYLGILPLIAAIALAARRWNTWLPYGERRSWYGVLIVAGILAIAAGTPVEHLIYHIPLYGRQRDTGRNIVEVDLAASALFTWWIDGGSRPRRERSDAGQLAALVLVGLVLVIGIWFTLSPSTLWHVLGARALTPRPRGTTGAIAIAIGLTAVAAAVVHVRARMTSTAWTRMVASFLFADLILFSAGSSYLSAEALPKNVRPGSTISLLRRALSPGGRYVVFDPGLFNLSQLPAAGEPDLNILSGLPAISGYGSLVDGTYAAATQTTARDYLDPAQIAAGTYAPLGLQAVVTVAESFLTPVAALDASATGPTLVEASGADPAIPGGNERLPLLPPVPTSVPPRAQIQVHTVASWFFGTRLDVTRALVHFPAAADSRTVRAGVIALNGRVEWGPATPVVKGSTSATFTLRRAPSLGFALEELRGASGFGPVAVAVASGARFYLVNGALSNAVSPSDWTDVGSSGPFTVFRSHAVPSPAWLVSAHAAPQVVIRATTSVHLAARAFDSAIVVVHTSTAATLVVSTAYNAGWHAVISTPTGRSEVAVRRYGLIEALPVPAGRSTVTLMYQPPGFALGLDVAASTAAALFLAIVVAIALRRRRYARGAAG